MIKVFYKSMTIEFECLADVIAFVEHFNPPDKLKEKSEYELDNPHNVDGYFETFYKCHKIYTSLDGKSYHVYGPGLFAVTYKTLEMAKSAIDLWEDSQKKVYEPIKFEESKDTKLPSSKIPHPQPIKNPMMVTIGSGHIEVTGSTPKRIDLQSFDELSVPLKKKRGRPKKVTEHDDKVIAIAGLSEKDEPQKTKEDLIMGIDDIAKELSRTKAMLFTEEALRKIFQKAYKPALKTDIKATYPLTQLDPQMCNRFVSEVSDKLGIKCTLSYKVGKTGFTYILMK